MKKTLCLLILGFSLFFNKLSAQIALSYYPFQSVLSISSNTENLVWVDARIQTNTFFSNLSLELNPMFNIKRTDWVNYYLGAGINFNPFYSLEDLPFANGYAFNAGARIKPIQKHKNIQVVFELSPYFNTNFDGGLLRTYLGLAYNF